MGLSRCVFGLAPSICFGTRGCFVRRDPRIARFCVIKRNRRASALDSSPDTNVTEPFRCCVTSLASLRGRPHSMPRAAVLHGSPTQRPCCAVRCSCCVGAPRATSGGLRCLLLTRLAAVSAGSRLTFPSAGPEVACALRCVARRGFLKILTPFESFVVRSVAVSDFQGRRASKPHAAM